jgi:hypothetical protein
MTSESAKREAPPVNPADLLAVWNLIREARAQKSPEDLTSITIHYGAVKKSCGPGVDVEAVGARTLMLDILCQVNPRWVEQPKAGKVMEVAARFPLNLPQLGVESNEPPFDVREFMNQIAALKR